MIILNRTVNEELFVPIARYLRYRRVIKLLPKKTKIYLADFGCDPEISFYHYCKQNKVQIEKFAGIDPLIDNSILSKYSNDKNIILIKDYVNKVNNLKSNFYDFVISLALLEHLEHPSVLISECIRILKPKGKLILTTPTPFSKPILELLSYKLHLLSADSIADHKRYFDRRSLYKLMSKYSNLRIEHKYFDFGVNNLLVVTKSN